jgi:uncharacterized protein YceH (UPF0502 family)
MEEAPENPVQEPTDVDPAPPADDPIFADAPEAQQQGIEERLEQLMADVAELKEGIAEIRKELGV